ncbi:MAG: GIY-YIG nuclease family protein [Patescibacteria group bacterium]
MPVKMQQKAPQSPGVYFFRNSKGKILYVGKANNLKARLNSYFQKNQASLKTKSLLKEASAVSWEILNSETEALIKESELIKKHSPKYNVLMRDDKQYFFAAFTKEEYPRIYLTHQTPNGPDYIGPFTDGGAIKSVLKLLRRAFPYCTCKRVHKNLCLNARIGKCLGFCCLTSSQTLLLRKEKGMISSPPSPSPYEGEGERGGEVYKSNISSIKKILTGKNKSLLKTLKKEMKKLSSAQKYEEAGKIRNQIRALEKVFAHKEIVSKDNIAESQKALRHFESILKIENIKRIEAYDIANIQGKYAYGSMVVFIDGAPAKDLYRIFKIKTVTGANDVAMLKEIISRRLSHKEWPLPEVILVDGGKQQLNAVRGGEVKIIALTKNKKHIGDHIYISDKKDPMPLNAIPSPLRNLLLNLDSEAHRFAIKHYRKSHRKTLS